MAEFVRNTLTVKAKTKEMLDYFKNKNFLNYDDINTIRTECSRMCSNIGSPAYAVYEYPKILSFHKLIPIPYASMVSASDHKNSWYNFCEENWGTRSDAQRVYFIDKGDHIVYKFKTLKTHPTRWFKRLISVYWDYDITMKTK